MRSSKSVQSAKSRRFPWRTAAAMATVTTGLVIAAPVAALAANPVTPTVTCYWPNADGSTTFAAGYINSGATSITYPIGALNYVTPSPQDRGQPTVFLAGTHASSWVATMSAADLASNPNWFVNGLGVSYSGNIPQCASKPVSVNGSTAGYLTATSVIVGTGLFVLASPRRRRALTRAARGAAPVSGA